MELGVGDIISLDVVQPPAEVLYKNFVEIVLATHSKSSHRYHTTRWRRGPIGSS